MVRLDERRGEDRLNIHLAVWFEFTLVHITAKRMSLFVVADLSNRMAASIDKQTTITMASKQLFVSHTHCLQLAKLHSQEIVENYFRIHVFIVDYDERFVKYCIAVKT